MDISVVIPLYNEEESLPELFAWIERVMAANQFSYEVIFVNDGSTDGSWKVIEQLKARSACVKGIKFRRNYGKSPALFCGFRKAEGDVVITMDADLQDSPDEIPELYRMITVEGYDLVSGYKKKRYDPLSKTIPVDAASHVPSDSSTSPMASKLTVYNPPSFREKDISRPYIRVYHVPVKSAASANAAAPRRVRASMRESATERVFFIGNSSLFVYC